MATLNPDLALLAAVAQAYGSGQAAQNLYCLADYGANIGTVPTPGDIEFGLALCRLHCYRMVASGGPVPHLVLEALGKGHVVLAHIRYERGGTDPRWCVLCDGLLGRWWGMTVDDDWLDVVVGSGHGQALSGHYVIVEEVLPGWHDQPSP